MAANGKAKLKLLYIRQMLEEETDAEHGLTMRQIIERLEAVGIAAERKGIYRDIELLREFGLDVRVIARNPAAYALVRRDFSLSELTLLVDAVQSSRFLTDRQAAVLSGNVKSLASVPQQALLDRRVHVTGRPRSESDCVFRYLDVVHEALRARRKVTFTYYRVGADGRRHATHGGAPHVVTPVGVVYDDGFYYLTAWMERHRGFSEFRIDRMGDLAVSPEPADANDEIAHHVYDETSAVTFGRFGGEEVTCTFAVHGDKVGIVLDRFGDRARLRQIGPDTAEAVVRVRKSEQFFGWVAGLGGAVSISGPKSLLDEYRAYLRRLLDGVSSDSERK